MKYYELISCTKFLQNFKSINSISRVEDNILKIDFAAKTTIFANLKRGSSTLFMCDNFQNSRRYQAPFDVALTKRFSNAVIERLEVSPNDRVLNIAAAQKGSYKVVYSTLVLELTGKNTNAIILDNDGVVVEALRHIGEDMSYRIVKVGGRLSSLPIYKVKEEIPPFVDARTFLHEEYVKMQDLGLANLKNSKHSELQKKISKLNSILDSIEGEDEIKSMAGDIENRASLLLANIHLLDKNAKECEIEDFNGTKHRIVFDKLNVSRTINELFSKSKRLKQRAKSVHIERENLIEKLDFLEKLSKAVLNAKSQEEVEILLPKRKSILKKEEQNDSFALFFVDGYKVMVGKNAKGNIQLLKNAKKNDIWFHIKDIPSAHVLLKTDKNILPESVLLFCAKLCVNFSSLGNGSYEVDYTPRRNVKMFEGSKVNYIDFKTIKVQKK